VILHILKEIHNYLFLLSINFLVNAYISVTIIENTMYNNPYLLIDIVNSTFFVSIKTKDINKYMMEPIKAKNPKHLFVHNQIFLFVFNCGDLYPNAFSPSLVEKKKMKIDITKHISPI